MQIAVLIRAHEGLSLVRYRENVMRELQLHGAILLPFNEHEPIPPCDVVWDPGMGRNRLPLDAFRTIDRPIVITLHGSATFTMKWREVYPGFLKMVRDKWRNVAAMKAWSWFRKKVSNVIAVSRYGAQEASLVYDLPPSLIVPIYHGVDSTVFIPTKSPNQTDPYLLHVSAYQPKKNVQRLIDAYARLPMAMRPKLIVVSPGIKKKPQIAGLTVIDRPLSPPELAPLYGNAMSFVFPSLHETFGLPILEAMACGCPVITSFDTGCAEVAGDAALLVNPRSTAEIAQAMLCLINEPELRVQLRQKGLERASQFTWSKTARLHLEVFRKVLSR